MTQRSAWLLGIGGLLNLLGLIGALLALERRGLDLSAIEAIYSALAIIPGAGHLAANHWHTLIAVGVLLTYLGRGTTPVGRWCHLVKGLQVSPSEVYASLERHIAVRAVPRIRTQAAMAPEGGFLGALRFNLCVKRRNVRFDVSAMRFGDSLGLSWRCYHRLRMHELLLTSLPLLGWLMYRAVYRYTPYAEDQALLFQALVQECLKDALGEVGSATGMRALTQDEFKPVLADLFRRW